MSVLNQSGEEQVECPLCMEPLEVDDLHFYPCTCGYQICRFCWNRIREGENGLCPACRKAYPENPADFTPLSQEQVAAIKTEKRAREQRRRNKTLESRRQLANVRVVQNNLVFVVGLPVRLAHPEILKRQEYFGKYGKIHKVVINQSTTYAGSQGPSASAYVTYVSGADALRAIQSVNNVSIDGRVLKGSLGTTKYCANFMKNQPCPKTDCMYLHELGDPKASFTKEQMHQGLHQIYERKLHNQLLAATAAAATGCEGGATAANGGGAGGTAGSGGTGSGGGKAGGTGPGNGGSGDKSSTKDGFIPTTIITSSNAHTVSSNKSKKDLQATSSSPSSTSSSSTSSSAFSSSGGKEAWPSLGCSPPTAGAGRVEAQQGQGQSITNADSSQIIGKNNRDSNTTENSNKNPGKSKDSINSQPKPSNSISIKNGGTRKGSCDDTYRNGSSDTEREQEDEEELVGNGYSDNKHFDNYMGDNLDIDTDDRHSLLDNHDLLDSSEHSLLEDELHSHNMNEAVLQRHMLDRQGIESNSLVDTFGLLDSNRDLRGYLADRIQNHSSLLESKELMMLRERQESEMLMRQSEMLARRNHLNMMGEQGKHYMGAGAGGLGLESTNELLAGAPYPPTSPHLLPSLGLSRLEGPRYGAGKPPSHLASNGDTRGAESGRYIGENSMDKFITDFHKNQQLKYLMQQQQTQVQPIQQTQGPVHHQPLSTSTDGIHHPFHPEMHSHAIIESQHLQRKYGNIVSNSNQQSGCGNTGSNIVTDESGVAAGTVSPAGHTPRIVDDDLDFDPFKETQKALAEMMESEVLVQQNGSGSSRADASERLRHSRPPPGFSHMNAFGIGVPRPQATPQGFSSSSAMISDWTQIDPAIMSTSVNFPQKNLLQQSLLTHQQQELYARFNQGLNINPQPPNGISKLLLNGQHPALAQQMQGMASQRLPQHNGMVLNPNQLINGQSNQQYLAPHLQQNKLQNIMSNPPNGWALNNLSPNFSGLNLNANGIYSSHVQAALLANGTVENTKAYNSISLPPGFTNLAQNSKASPIPTECIESK